MSRLSEAGERSLVREASVCGFVSTGVFAKRLRQIFVEDILKFVMLLYSFFL
jgi:hypothetical protein